jgi:hypothetical protein
MTTWLRITLYVVQEDRYKKIPLDFIWCVLLLESKTLGLLECFSRLLAGHSGYYLVQEVAQCLEDFKITNHVSQEFFCFFALS